VPAVTAAPASAAARWRWLGRVPFGALAEEQETLRRQLLAGAGPETLLLLEHHPVITLGRSAPPAHVLAAADELQRRGVAVHRASRGGDVTYHGPGQLVGYPIVKLERGVVGHLGAMADGLIAVLAGLGITAEWRRQAPGLWVRGPGGDAKICAFGVNVHRRVAIHGFALNVAVDLDAFRLIVPCGLAGAAVTSIAQLTGRAPPLEPLAVEVASALSRSFGRAFERDTPPALDAARARRATASPIADPLGDPSADPRGDPIDDRI
jgi:lipoyl(octanoyl) transferase